MTTPAGTPRWVKDNLKTYLRRWFALARQAAANEVSANAERVRWHAKAIEAEYAKSRQQLNAELEAARKAAKTALYAERDNVWAELAVGRAQLAHHKAQWADAKAQLESAWRESRNSLEARVNFFIGLSVVLGCGCVWLGFKGRKASTLVRLDRPAQRARVST